MIKNKNESKNIIKSNSGTTAISKWLSSYFPIGPTSLNKPAIDKDFNSLPPIERVTESLIYNLLFIEYSISPKGGLRQWIKINVSLLLFLGIPILILISLGTFVMGGLADITGQFANVTQFLLVSAQNILKLIGVVIVIGTTLYIIFKLPLIIFYLKQRNGKKKNNNF